MIHWGKRLDQILEKYKIKQYELAEKMGVTQGNISQITGKDTFQLELAEKICETLEISLSEFTDIDGAYKVDYVSLGITPEQLKFLRAFNGIPKKKQQKLLRAFFDITDSILD